MTLDQIKRILRDFPKYLTNLRTNILNFQKAEMNSNIQKFGHLLILLNLLISCNSNKSISELSLTQKAEIKEQIKKEIEEGIKATRTKNIELYMSQLPNDLILIDENGKLISKEQQRENTLRDWAIIDTTLNIEMKIDSIRFLKKDSVIVFTSQSWERMMFQRDGIKTDTVLTTQKHRETWKRNDIGWFGYYIEELGGTILINGKEYNPE